MGIEKKGKRTSGHGQQCGDCWEKGAYKGTGKEVNGVYGALRTVSK